MWFMTAGKAKTSDVYYIVVLKNGKARTYRIYDDDTTLGKVSKMSNGEAIRFAKQQDKKYFDASVKELKLAKNRNGHDGFNADFQDEINIPSYNTLAKNDNLVGLAIDSDYYDKFDEPLHVIFNKNGQMTSSNKGTTIPNDVYVDHATIPVSTDENQQNMVIQNRVYDAVIDQAEDSSYHAPEAVTVKATSKTDDSGNDIVSQKVTIRYTDNLDSDKIADNFLSMAEKSPSMMKQLYDGQKKFFDVNHGEGAETATTAQAGDAQKAYQNTVDKMFTKKFCASLTKGVFGNHQEDYTLHLEEPTEFDIYDANFIGYYRGKGNGYLVTKAQNDKQTAVFAK